MSANVSRPVLHLNLSGTPKAAAEKSDVTAPEAPAEAAKLLEPAPAPNHRGNEAERPTKENPY